MKFLGKTLRYVFRQGLAANLEAAKATAHRGEPHWTTDTKRAYISDANGGEAGHEMRELAMMEDLPVYEAGDFDISNLADQQGKRVQWDTAYQWGDHADVGYLTSESDPVFAASPAAGIGAPDIGNWNTAYGWGDHADVGYELQTNKGANNGYAGLDSGGKIPAANLPNTIMSYEGTWNADTNTPELLDGVAPAHGAGTVYLCNVAGTTDFGGGAITFAVGDWAVYSGSVWERSDNTDAVVSVNSQTGVVDVGFEHLSGAPSDVITAGDNLSWTNNTLDAVNTTYTAGDGLSLTGTVFANTDGGAAAVTSHEGAHDHTKLHDALTISGENYLSLVGQELTAAAVNLASHVTGTLPVANGGTAKTGFNAGQLLYGALNQSSNLAFNGTDLTVSGKASTSRGFGYASTSFSAVSGTWYTIATVQGTRAHAMFEVWDESSAKHGGVRFTAGQTHPSTEPEFTGCLTVLGKADHKDGGIFDGIRIREGSGSSSMSFLQIQASANGTLYVVMSDNRINAGWTLVAGTSTGDQGSRTIAEVSTNQYPGLYSSRHSLFGADLAFTGDLKNIGSKYPAGSLLYVDGNGVFQPFGEYNEVTGEVNIDVPTNIEGPIDTTAVSVKDGFFNVETGGTYNINAKEKSVFYVAVSSATTLEFTNADYVMIFIKVGTEANHLTISAGSGEATMNPVDTGMYMYIPYWLTWVKF